MIESGGLFLKGSETEGVIPNGVYVPIQLDDNFGKCISEYSLDTIDEAALAMIPTAKFTLVIHGYKMEQCILENFIIRDQGYLFWVIKICEEDDNLFELYGGITEEYQENPYFLFLVSIPYYIPEKDRKSVV